MATEAERVKKAAQYQANRDAVRARARAWYHEHREAVLSRLAADKDALYAKQAVYRASNPDVMKAKRERRRSAERNAEGTHDARDRDFIRSLSGHMCARCGSGGKLQIDHIVPLARGGSNWPSNLQALCRSCNCQKHTRIERWSGVAA